MTANKNQNPVIRAKRSKSGSTYYGDPVILKDNSRTRVSFVPFFIPHSNHKELASKIVTWKKTKTGQTINEEKSVSLSGEETQQLLKALKSHLAVASGGEASGDYIAIRVGSGDGATDFGEHDPKTVANALTGVLGQSDILEHLKDTELSVELRDALRGAIRLREISTAIEQLRQMLNTGVVLEREYQKWCDDHYWAFGNVKQITDTNRNISISDQVDKLLPDITSGLSDVIELKRPNMDVLKYDSDHRNFYFSKDTSSAIGQCHRYLDVLHDAASQGLRDHPEIVAYHPRATIVIGRSHDWDSEKTRALHGLNQRLRSIKIMTYDHLLAQSETILSLLKPNDSEDQMAQCSIDNFDLDDEIPF